MALSDSNHTEFELLFKMHFKELSLFAMKYLHDLDDAKSLVHDVFITLWEKYDGMERDSNYRSYLYTAVRNRCLNTIRDRKKVVSIDAVDQEKGGTETNELETSELATEIDFAINALPEKCREVFLLSRQEELKYAQIAEKMQISVKTVEAQMSKALKLMRSHLAEFLSVLFFLIMR